MPVPYSRCICSVFTIHSMPRSHPWEMQSASMMRMPEDSPEAFSPTIWLTSSCRANRFSRCFCSVTSRSRQRIARACPAFWRRLRLNSRSITRPSGVWWRNGARSTTSPSSARRKSAVTSAACWLKKAPQTNAMPAWPCAPAQSTVAMRDSHKETGRSD